jgi:site-specific recombinase XerD
MVRWWDEKEQKWKAIKGGITEDEAMLAAAQLRQDLWKDLDPIAQKRKSSGLNSISNLIDLFYKKPSFMSKSPRWREVMKCHLEGPIRRELGSIRSGDLNREKILKFYMGLKQSGLSHSTIKRYHFILCQLLDLHVEQEPESLNPVRMIKDFKKNFPKQAPTRDINFMVPEEIDALMVELRKLKSRIMLPFVQLLTHTGLRRNEALELKWTDIDEKAGFIHVRGSKNGESRAVPLEPQAKEALKLLNRRAGYVFTSAEGKRYREGGFLKPLQKAAKAAGIEKRIDIHTLRHSYGSNKIRQGWGLKKVSMLLGHKDIAITPKVYSHLLDGDLKVRDEFHFDNSTRKENSGESRDKGSDAVNLETLMKTIQLLQKQLEISQKQNSAFAQSGEQKNPEISGNIQTDSTKCLQTDGLCYSNATQMTENKKSQILSNPASSKISSHFASLATLKVAHPRGLASGTRTFVLVLQPELTRHPDSSRGPLRGHGYPPRSAFQVLL